MISVPFDIDTHEFREVGALGYLQNLQTQAQFPWLEFLFEHAHKIEHSQHYKYSTMEFAVRFSFYLSPEDETMYYLKYTK